MLRIVVNNVASAAKSYYTQGLTKGDYYTQEKETDIVGKWGGKGCEFLGLDGIVDPAQYAKLCDNINPETDEKLTQRNNDNRRVGYDINFHAPKSVSVVYAITRDEDILNTFRDAVSETMQAIEKDMQARVRIGGKNENRETGNIVYGEFIHTTSRPVDGVPDPHLHAHCFTFNSTFDHEEQKWKAGEFGKIKKDASYFEAYFHSSFSSKLKAAGYDIDAGKKGWEIAGLDKATLKKFSRRTTEIEEIAKEKGITDARAKDKLGAKTRKGKDKNLTSNDLYKTWLSTLTDAEKTDVYNAKKTATNNNSKDITAANYIQNSVEHILERKSVSTEREILRDALKKSYGVYTPHEILQSYSGENLLRAKGDNEILLTTREAVIEERRLIKFATESKAKFAPIFRDYEIQNEDLNVEQHKAVKHALSSRDGVIIIEGGAGTGKTTLMKELKIAINETGRKIIPFAPSAEASRGVLQSEGFKNADTVAQLLQSTKMQESVKNGIIWIDEAGLLGNKTMNAVFEIAKEQNARIILTGDTRQHNSVERGDAMRLILEKSKIASVRVNEIQRQRNNAPYKQTVKDISENRLDDAFAKLEHMNVIHEIAEPENRYAAIAKDYVSSVKAKSSVLVIAPTHNEGNRVTSNIRQVLKTEKIIGKEEKQFEINKNLNPTEAEKKDSSYYRAGMSVQFHQNVKGVKRGSIYDVSHKDAKGNVVITGEGKEIILPVKEANKFSVYEKAEINLAKGDAIRITQNGFSMNEKRLNNGNNLTVKGFDNDGNIIAHNGNQQILIGKDHRNFSYGYCSTSHSSQGKTVDKVIISQSAISSPAASKEQFYVSVSRGKNNIAIYTDDKKELRQSVTTSSQRMNATDIFRNGQKQSSVMPIRRQQILVSRLTTLSRNIYQQVANSINRVTPRR